MKTLEKLFFDQLADIYYAEKQLVKALPKLAAAASGDKLKKAIGSHLAETKQHVSRIEDAYASLERKPRARKCEAIIGLLEEGDSLAAEFGDTEGIDAALICAAQKVEHYEIATYGCLVTWAKAMKFNRAATLLAKTLDEEEAADLHLTKIAEGSANAAAQ